MEVSRVKKIEMLRMMVRIRRFEEKVSELFARGQIPGFAHLYIGEEAVAAGACANLRKEDYITSTHRGHGHCVAKGGDLKFMMAEIFGKKTGYCKGKGGSMHIADQEVGILGAIGIVASGIPIAVGAALSAKLRKTDQMTVCFFGDGATNQGPFHESLNMAAVFKLPVIFLCENNLYAISTPQSKHQTIKDVTARAVGYDMPGMVVDGNDVLAVYEAVQEAIRRGREGKGPTLIEAKTYRWRGHHEGDVGQGTRYRPKEEIQAWMEKCPIKKFKEVLLREGSMKQQEIDQLEEEVNREIEAAVEFAQQSPMPGVEDLFADLYAEPTKMGEMQ